MSDYDETKGYPNSFPARLFEVGDWWAFSIVPDQVYEIFGRKDDGSGVIQFSARRSNEPGAEPIDYEFTFPADMPVSARRRIRTITVPCLLCKTPGEHTTDTAYYTVNGAICGRH